MSDTTERRDWQPEQSSSPADRLIESTLRFFLLEPVAASAVVLMFVGALSGSGVAAWIGFVVAMLFASHLRARYERHL